MTERNYKKFAQEKMMKHTGIKFPMIHMQLLEYHPRFIEIEGHSKLLTVIDEVVFRDSRTNLIYLVTPVDYEELGKEF